MPLLICQNMYLVKSPINSSIIMCKNNRCCLKCLNIFTKFRACIFWAILNIVFGVAVVPYVISFVGDNDLPIVITVFGCLCGIYLLLSGVMLLVGVLKGIRSMVCSSIVICGLGVFFIHWLIIPLVLYFIFSFVVFTYYQVDMAPDDRYRVPRQND